MRNSIAGVLVLVFSSCGLAQNACFSFLNAGDVWLRCDAKEVQVTTTHDVMDFAFAANGKYLALEREHVLRKTKDTAFIECSTRVYDLSSSSEIRDTQHLCGRLYGTCGTILLETRHSGVHDVVAGGQVALAGYERFVCTGDRSVMAGWPGEDDKDFSIGRENCRKLASIAGGASINDAGQIAYWTESSNTNSVCVAAGSHMPLCLNNADAFDGISISDSGKVLFSTHTEGGCWYRKRSIVRAQPPDSGEDQCVGIALWEPGSTKAIVKDLVGHPQWLSASAAVAAQRCSSSRSGCVPSK